MLKHLAIIGSAIVVLSLGLSSLQAGAGSCISDSALADTALSEGWAPLDQPVSPATIGTDRAKQVALAHGVAGQTVLGSRLAQLRNTVFGSRTVYLIAMTPMPNMAPNTASSCEIQVVDASSGNFLYGFQEETPISGSTPNDHFRNVKGR